MTLLQIFIGGLPLPATDAQLEEFASAIGEVRNPALCCHSISGGQMVHICLLPAVQQQGQSFGCNRHHQMQPATDAEPPLPSLRLCLWQVHSCTALKDPGMPSQNRG